MWDQVQADLAAITGPNKAAYCQRWGYRWIPSTALSIDGRPVAWSKVHFIREALQNHEWVFWSDADSLITNPSQPLTPLLRDWADLVVTRDLVGFNSGSFLLRRCPWSFEFLDEVWAFPATAEYRRQYDLATDRLWENRAIILLLRANRHRRHTRVVPQRRLNAYLPDLCPTPPNGAYHPGDFVLHLPGVAHATRLKTLAAYAAAMSP